MAFSIMEINHGVDVKNWFLSKVKETCQVFVFQRFWQSLSWQNYHPSCLTCSCTLSSVWLASSHVQRSKQYRQTLKHECVVPQLEGGLAEHGRGLEQPLEHAAGAAVLQTLVRRQAVLGAVAAVAELAHV